VRFISLPAVITLFSFFILNELAQAAGTLKGFVIQRSAEYGQTEQHSLRCVKSKDPGEACELTSPEKKRKNG
jgi:hypothetical protein